MPQYAVNPPELKDARSIGYNHAIIGDGEFYMAGQVAMDSNNTIVGDDIKTQTQQVYENIGILLGAIGKSYADVTKVTTHIVDPNQRYFDGYKTVYQEVFSEPYPCHTVLGHEQLAHAEYLVEVEVKVPITESDIEQIEPDGDTIRQI